MCFPITLDLCPSIYGQLFYLQDILINVIYAHILFLVPFPALIYLSPILSHMLFIFAFTFSPTMARLLQKKKISLVTYEVICLSLNNDCECKTPASWNMFALWRWSRLFSSCPHAFFFSLFPLSTKVSFSLKNIHSPLLHRCLFFFLMHPELGVVTENVKIWVSHLTALCFNLLSLQEK